MPSASNLRLNKIREEKMNSYEAKQQARRERFEERAERAKDESNARFEKAHESIRHIPPGQPILVDHHSAARHRRDLKNHDRNMRAGIEADNKAAHYERKAKGVGQGGVSSDDPDAIKKLREQLEKRVEAQSKMKAVNAAIRKGDDEKLRALGLTDHQITELKKPDFCGHVGFASFELSNNNASITRLKKRIAELEKAATAESKEQEFDGFTLVENTDANRIQFLFNRKPSAEVRAILKGEAFRWSRNNEAWQRHLNNAGRYAAKVAIQKINELIGEGVS